MENKPRYVDEIFHFPGHWEMPSLCGVQIRRREEGVTVILTELYQENPGSSVTGMVEAVATGVVKRYSLEPEKTEFIVHNPERSSKYEFFSEMFYRAKMQWDGEKYCDVFWEKLEGLPITED